MKAVKLIECTRTEEAKHYLETCFNSESVFDIKPSDENFDVYYHAYQALLAQYSDNKQKVIAISYWGIECGLNQL